MDIAEAKRRVCDEIDQMLQDEVIAEESRSELDDAIADGLADVRKELGKEE